MSDENLPPERDVKDYKFQQLCKVQVRDAVQAGDIKGFYSLIDTSSRYGLTFVGIQNGFKVLRTQEFIDQDSKHTSDRLQYVITNIPLVCVVDVGHQVTHVAVSCDGLTLAVGVSMTERCQLNMYDVRAFAQTVTGSVSPFLMVNLGNDDLIDLAWNPSGHTFLVTCQASGKLDLYSITENLEIKATLPTAKAKCVCWSPKGKQLVVGTNDGRLVQYDFELKEKRKWDYPASVFEDQSYYVMSIVWLSTYTFLAGYLSSKAEPSDQPNLVLVNGSKDGPTAYVNLEDICFGTGENGPKKYFFNFIQQWDMVITGSCNASEIAIMAKHMDQKQTWERWNLDDSARAECPLTEDYTDTYPLGMTVDLSSQTVISLGDERTHPPSPLMLILTTAGHVIPYHCMYMHKDAPQITAAPEVLSKTGCRQPIGGQTATPAATQPVGGSTSAAKNLFGTSTNQSKPLFGSGNQPIGAQNTNTTFTFGSQPETKPLFSGLGQAENQAPFGTKFTTPATQPGQTVVSKPGLFAGSSGGSSFNFSAPTTKGFGLTELPNQQTSSMAQTTTAQGLTGFGSIASTAVSSAPSAGFGSFAMSMTASTTSIAAGTPTFSFGANLGQSSTPFHAKPIASVASDAVGTKFNTSSITTPSTFNFATKSAGQPAGFGLASPAGFATGSKPNLPSTQAPQPQPVGSNLFGKQAGSNTPVSQTSQSIMNPGRPASFGVPSAPATAAPGKEKSGSLPTPPTVSSSTPSHIHKSSTLTSLAQIAEPESTAPVKFQPRSPEHAPPPAYPTNQSLTMGATSEVARPNVDENNQLGDTVDRSFAKSIQEEIQHFEKELRDLKTRAGKTECEIGAREDMIRLRTKTAEMGKFCEDIKKTVQEQNKDVQEQTSLCLDMFAMVEECRVRQQLNSDPKYKSLLKSRALDSASAEKLQDLQLQNQALDQGLRDVDMILDSQWEEYQSRKKNLSRRVQAPTNDAIYRVVKSNHNLILAQKSRVKEMEEKLKQLKLYNKTSTWNNTGLSQYSGGDTSTMLSSLADSLVDNRPVTSSSRVSSDSGSTRSNKLAQLRDHLYHRHVPVVRSTKPENLSMSRLTIPDRNLIHSPPKPQPAAVQDQRTTLKGPEGSKAAVPQTFLGGPGQVKAADPGDKPLTVKQAVPQEPVPSFTGTKKATNTPNSGQSSFVFSKPTGTSPSGQFQFIGRQSTGQTFTGFGLGSEAPTKGVAVPKVNEINGIKFEDITPSGSENEIETTEEEDEEYDEEEEEEEESSGESYGAGFGLQYSMTGQGSQVTSTPVAAKPPTGNVATPKAQASSTPVGRKLFGQDQTNPAGTFQFGAAKTEDTGFSLGGAPPVGKPAKPVYDTSQNKSGQTGPLFTSGQNKQPETAADNQSEETSAATGFNFGKSSGSGFNFGSPNPKTTSTGISGLFGNKATSSTGPQVPISSQSKPFNFGTGSAPQFTALASAATSSSTVETSATAPSSDLSAGDGTTVSTTPDSTPGSSSLSGQKPTTKAGPTFVGFGVASTSTSLPSQTTGKPLFGSSGLFGSSPVVQPSSSTDSSKEKSGLATSTSTAGGLFGKGESTSFASSSLFGQGTTDTTSNLGALLSASDSPSDNATNPGSTDKSQSSTTAQPGTSGFGQSSTSTQASTLFGQSGPSSQSSSFSFGQSTITTQSGTPLFGQTSSSQNSVTGQTTTSSGGSLFGQTTTNPSGGLFGQTTTSSSGGLFGQTTTSSSGGLFGQTTTSSSGGLFGQTTTSNSGIFGSQTTNGGGLFGKPATTSSAFGQSQTSSSGGLFGSSTTTTASGPFTTPSTSGTGLFGTSVSSSSTGLFGFSSAASNSSPFGMSSTATSSGPFGTSVTSSGTGSFGSASSNASSFSFGKPAFGQSPSFGQTASPGSGLGGSGGLFGQSNEGGGGGLFAGLGGKPSEEKANTNVFGGGTFGSQAQNSSSGLFGSSSSSTFGASTSTGGGGLFTGGGAGVGSTGFGSGQQPSGSGFGSSGFGAAPAFGGSPAFGSPPRFGSSPGFGGGGFGTQPTFGAASPIGGAGGGATFGSASATSGAGFAGFASAGSPTFGALAQSSDAPTFGSLTSGGNPGFGSPSFGGGQQNQPAFGGNTFGSSPQFTGYRG